MANLHTVFRRYQLGGDFDACPCCHAPEAGYLLRAKALNKLSPGDLPFLSIKHPADRVAFL